MKAKLQGKLRFVSSGERYKVMARRKSDGEWGLLGYCHPSAKSAIISGDLSLLVPVERN
jgi:hypothetical protein